MRGSSDTAQTETEGMVESPTCTKAALKECEQPGAQQPEWTNRARCSSLHGHSHRQGEQGGQTLCGLQK